jgi:hypothetical protein
MVNLLWLTGIGCTRRIFVATGISRWLGFARRTTSRDTLPGIR